MGLIKPRWFNLETGKMIRKIVRNLDNFRQLTTRFYLSFCNNLTQRTHDVIVTSL